MLIDDAELQGIFAKYGISGTKDLDLQLADAHVFYQVGSGQVTAGKLMTTFLQMWPKETMDRVAKELVDWLTATGYLRADLYKGTPEDKERISAAFLSAVERLCDEAQIAKAEWPWYAARVGSMVAGNKEIIDRIAGGDLTDLEQFFAQVHSRRVASVTQVN